MGVKFSFVDQNKQHFQLPVSVANGLDYASFQIMTWKPHCASNVLSPTIQVTTRAQLLQQQATNANTSVATPSSNTLHQRKVIKIDTLPSHNLDCIIPGQSMALVCAFSMELLPFTSPRHQFIQNINKIFNNNFCSPTNLHHVTQEEATHT